MSSFWSGWIIVISLFNIFGCAALLFWTRKMPVAHVDADNTTGHEYDGIKEYNNPLPRWWMWMFVGTIIFALIYLALFPGLGNFPGILGWTSHKEHDEGIAEWQAEYGPMYAAFYKQSIPDLIKDPKALRIGQRIFLNNCAACHGSDARGARGFPNLTDNDWLYGGTPDRIEETILNGRQGGMPTWGPILGKEKIEQVANYVLSLSGRDVDADLAAKGKQVFMSNCVACHGPDGKGNQMIGAPNLTDTIWLYGGSKSTVIKSITEGRRGRMPSWKDRLGPEKVHLVAAYVYSLSHGNSM